jgi:hypothetical protein
MTRKLRIGGASGYWGESPMAVPQFLAEGGLDCIVFDYLAEITMSIMARARAKDENAGYARDFVTAALGPHLEEIARQRVKIISNAGGVNPRACAEAVRAALADKGLKLKVAVVLGDDLMDRVETLSDREMFTNAPFPPAEKVASVNAYLGAAPIARALAEGADIVITGRVVDSAVTLGACLHAFGWAMDDWDRLSAGTLAGHILECGPQATGGNFTDWEAVADSIDRIGYPIAEIEPSGAFEVTKPKGTGGAVTVGTVGEQMLYEIGDPQAYLVPDVACDFSTAHLSQTGPDRVRVEGATGRPAPTHYKVSATWFDGFRGGSLHTFYGFDAEKRARTFADAALSRTREALRARNLGDLTETSVEILGAGSQFGNDAPSREVVLKLGAKHPDSAGIETLIRSATGLGLAAPSGLSGFQAGRPKPSPVVRLFSFLSPKSDVPLSVEIDGRTIPVEDAPTPGFDPSAIARPAPPPAPPGEPAAEVPLVRLAFGRSGDKGDKANIGIMARKPEYLPWIWAALTEANVSRLFAHFLEGEAERFLLPGSHAVNFLLHETLGGGGVASLRNDPQAKGYAQILLAAPIPVSRDIANGLA